MLKISLFVLMWIAVVTSTEECGQPLREVCNERPVPQKFPETEDEYKDVCDFAIGFLGCAIKYEENCDESPKLREQQSGYLRAAKDICDEDTLLYAAIVENLKCFSNLAESDFGMMCKRQSQDSSSVAKYVEALKEEGHLALTDDEHEISNTHVCVQTLYEMACTTIEIENACGTLAKDTFLEVIEKFDMTDFSGSECSEILRLLPVMIRLYKLEQEETNEIVDALKKRK